MAATAAGRMAQWAKIAAARNREEKACRQDRAYSTPTEFQSEWVGPNAINFWAKSQADCMAMLIPSATTGCSSPAALPT